MAFKIFFRPIPKERTFVEKMTELLCKVIGFHWPLFVTSPVDKSTAVPIIPQYRSAGDTSLSLRRNIRHFDSSVFSVTSGTSDLEQVYRGS